MPVYIEYYSRAFIKDRTEGSQEEGTEPKPKINPMSVMYQLRT